MVRTHTLIATLILLVTCALPTTATAAANHKHAHHCKHHYRHTNPRKPDTARHTTATTGTINPTVTIASTFAEPCQNTQLTPTPENLQVIREATFCLINQERARNNELPLHVNLQGQAAKLISEHSQAAHILAIVYVLFTATLIVTFAAQRISGGMPTGLGILDGLLTPKPMLTALRIVLVVLSLIAGYMCFRTGDLGAKAVWEGRIQAAHAGSGGPGERGLAPPPGTGTP